MSRRDEIRIRATAPVSGADYDELLASARAAALRLLGPDRTDYWLDLGQVTTFAEAQDGTQVLWSGQAAIVWPHVEPAF